MAATLKFNADRSLCELHLDGDEWGPLDASEAGHFLLDDDSGDAYYLALTDDDGLIPDTLYKLEPVTIEVEEGAEIETEEEDEGDEDDSAENGKR